MPPLLLLFLLLLFLFLLFMTLFLLTLWLLLMIPDEERYSPCESEIYENGDLYDLYDDYQIKIA